MKEFLVLYSQCVLVKGVSRTALLDLQRNNIHFIPNTLYELFADECRLDLRNISEQLSTEDIPVFNEYCEFLLLNDLGFYCNSDEVDLFPRLGKEYLYPSTISNAIFDAINHLSYFDQNLLAQLDTLQCRHIQLRFFGLPDNGYLRELMELIDESPLKSVELIIANINDKDEIIDLANSYAKLTLVLVFNAGYEETRYAWNGTPIYFNVGTLKNESHCGAINPAFFTVNTPTYIESLDFNSCLNRKLGIDINGEIKNCPSMTESYGNIRESLLIEAVSKPEFQKYWSLSKDKINTCCQCEFRRVCTDCRAYLENPTDDSSKPLKCGYDPYTTEWTSWSTNPLKLLAITHYGLD